MNSLNLICMILPTFMLRVWVFTRTAATTARPNMMLPLRSLKVVRSIDSVYWQKLNLRWHETGHLTNSKTWPPNNMNRTYPSRRTKTGEEMLLAISCWGWPFVDRMLRRVSFTFHLPRLIHREDLRRRFIKSESTLFRVRYNDVMQADREELLKSQRMHWIRVNR